MHLVANRGFVRPSSPASCTLSSATDPHLLVNVGWDDERRIHGCLVHIEILNGKVWIQRDGTEHGVAKALVQAGIPKDQIVLGFQAPERRKYTDYAVR